jgi:hypothetical protein
MAQDKRTYIRAISIGTNTVVFQIPDWNTAWFELSRYAVPAHLRQYLHPGFRVNVTVNLDAPTKDELDIRDWGLH